MPKTTFQVGRRYNVMAHEGVCVSLGDYGFRASFRDANGVLFGCTSEVPAQEVPTVFEVGKAYRGNSDCHFAGTDCRGVFEGHTDGAGYFYLRKQGGGEFATKYPEWYEETKNPEWYEEVIAERDVKPENGFVKGTWYRYRDSAAPREFTHVGQYMGSEIEMNAFRRPDGTLWYLSQATGVASCDVVADPTRKAFEPPSVKHGLQTQEQYDAKRTRCQFIFDRVYEQVSSGPDCGMYWCKRVITRGGQAVGVPRFEVTLERVTDKHTVTVHCDGETLPAWEERSAEAAAPPMPGQTRELHGRRYFILDETGGRFLVRADDRARRWVLDVEVNASKYVDGRTTPETERETLERLRGLAMELRPQEGVSVERWARFVGQASEPKRGLTKRRGFSDRDAQGRAIDALRFILQADDAQRLRFVNDEFPLCDGSAEATVIKPWRMNGAAKAFTVNAQRPRDPAFILGDDTPHDLLMDC